jgi:environmental stress-induced protein Ves
VSRFQWQRRPSQAWDKTAWINAMAVAVEAALQVWSPQIESYAKRNARWRDRTANARQTLAAFTFYDGGERTVYLIMKQHMDYGVWLELKNGGRYAIVMESMQMHYAQVWNQVQQAVR